MEETPIHQVVQEHDWIDTPALIVDGARMERNISRVQAIADRHGVAFRPHIKTHKTIEIARAQLDAGAVGVTAAKLTEARHFIDAGISDVFVAFTITGPTKSRLAAELASNARLIVGTDNDASVRHLSDACRAHGSQLHVRLEVDTGLARGGVRTIDEAYNLARSVAAAPGLELDGIYTFRSSTFSGNDGRGREELGREEGEIMSDFADALRNRGVVVGSVSVGSTPTGATAATGRGVTEIRAGTYVFNDYLMRQLGVAGADDIALTVLATVVSRPQPDVAIVDAGSKALSPDFYPGRLGLEAYAVAADGREIAVVRLSEEHGVCRVGRQVELGVGDRVAFVPSHSCTTVNLADELLMFQPDGSYSTIRIVARGATR